MIRYPENQREEEFPQEEEQTFDVPEVPGERKGSVVPILQAAACILILLGLAVLKYARPEMFGQITHWYREESAKVIDLPRFQREDAQSSVTGEGEQQALLPAAGAERV